MGKRLDGPRVGISLTVFLIIIMLKGTVSLLCYNCDNLEDNNQCLNVTQCPQGEVCYTRTDGLRTGKIVHTTGCTVNMTSPASASTDHIPFCEQQCSQSLCNLDKCFATANISRGPHCLSCDHVPTVDSCSNVTQCETNEICFLRKVTAFGNIHYRMGCVDKRHCQPVRNQPVLGRRTVNQSRCSLCCDHDHCNQFACSSQTADIGTQYLFQPANSDPDCVDSDQPTCSVFGTLNPAACQEPVVAAKCPKSCDACDLVFWQPWNAWSACSATCGTGTHHRSRECVHMFNLPQHHNCTGRKSMSGSCMDKHCPINGGWCTESSCSGTCYDYAHGSSPCNCNTITTTCRCPSPQYGGLDC